MKAMSQFSNLKIGTRSSAQQMDAMLRTVDVDVKYAMHTLEARAA